MACLLGRVQEILTLLSLRCAIANRFMNFYHLKNSKYSDDSVRSIEKF